MEEIVRNPYNEYIDFHATMKHVGGIPGKRGGVQHILRGTDRLLKAAVPEMERAGATCGSHEADGMTSAAASWSLRRTQERQRFYLSAHRL